MRNATFVTPAIGASTTGLGSAIGPIRSADRAGAAANSRAVGQDAAADDDTSRFFMAFFSATLRSRSSRRSLATSNFSQVVFEFLDQQAELVAHARRPRR